MVSTLNRELPRLRGLSQDQVLPDLMSGERTLMMCHGRDVLCVFFSEENRSCGVGGCFTLEEEYIRLRFRAESAVSSPPRRFKTANDVFTAAALCLTHDCNDPGNTHDLALISPDPWVKPAGSVLPFSLFFFFSM